MIFKQLTNRTNNMRLFYLFMVTFITSSFSIFGQSIKDFYIPSEKNYDLASFYVPNLEGGRSGHYISIYYTKLDSLNYEVLERKSFLGKTIIITSKTIIITPTEVKMISSSTTNSKVTNKNHNFVPAVILLKMPKEGQASNWTIIEQDNSITTYSSTLITLTIDEMDPNFQPVYVKKKAIMVIRQQSGNTTKKVSYYVQGIGLMKEDFLNNQGLTEHFCVFDGLSKYKP